MRNPKQRMYEKSLAENVQEILNRECMRNPKQRIVRNRSRECKRKRVKRYICCLKFFYFKIRFRAFFGKWRAQLSSKSKPIPMKLKHFNKHNVSENQAEDVLY